MYAYDTQLAGHPKKCTVIELINTSEQESSPPRRLYMHPGLHCPRAGSRPETIEVVSASINSPQKLLAFSTAARFQSLSAQQSLQTTYDAYLVDISDPRKQQLRSVTGWGLFGWV